MIIVLLIFLSFHLFLIFYVFAPSSVDKLYYVSNTKIYLKLHREATSDTLNIFLTRDINAHLTGREDCIRTNQNFPITLIFDKSNSRKIIIPSHCKDGILEIQSNKFDIVCSNDKYADTLFFKPMKEYGIDILKKPFSGIVISEYIENVYVVFPDDSSLTKINEIIK